MIEIKKVIDDNEYLLLKYYNSSLREIKKLIIEAAIKGNETRHLKTIQSNIKKEAARLNSKFYYYSTENIAYVYAQGIKTQENQYNQLNIPFEPVKATAYTSFAGLHSEALAVIAVNTYKPLGQLTEIIGRDCNSYLTRTNFKEAQSVLKGLTKFIPDSQELRRIAIQNSGRIVRGDIAWQKAMKNIKDHFAAKDIFKVPYYKKDGTFSHFVQMKDYAKMVARTTAAEAYRIGEQNSILETFGDDGDLVQIVGHSVYPKSPCIPFEDKILSLTGITEDYTTIDEAKAQGLFHPNCIHHFAVTKKVIEIYNNQ